MSCTIEVVIYREDDLWVAQALTLNEFEQLLA